MYKHILFLICIWLVLPIAVHAEDSSPTIAFIRQHDLWIKNGEQEQQITFNQKVEHPKWSSNGTFIAYIQNKELWVYNVLNSKHFRVDGEGVYNYQWEPTKNSLAFQKNSSLYAVDIREEHLSQVKKIKGGVGNYSWIPGSKALITSNIAKPIPFGWDGVLLHKVYVSEDLTPRKVKKLAELPGEGRLKNFFAISTSEFKFSPSGNWISFLAIPTASWSMDSNTLCIISTDGKSLATIDKMILKPEWFQWAPEKNKLAYIEGEGRIALQDKELKVKELPAFTSGITPKGFVDWDFTWLNNEQIVISHAKEADWSNHPYDRPLPHLVKLDVTNNTQAKQVTSPSKNSGDFFPYFDAEGKKLYWIRTDRNTASIWRSHIDGSQSELFIENIDIAPVYYEAWSWEQMVDFH